MSWLEENVSRETIDRLKAYESLILKWNPVINVVAKSTLTDIWVRHIEDSAQIVDFAPDGIIHWVDLGSGGGLPGVVAALILAERSPDAVITLIESDKRKAAFLRTAALELGCSSISVVSDRIESVKPQRASILSARALAKLDVLLSFAEKHLAANGIALFQKGMSFQSEIDEARKRWVFDLEVFPSKTDPHAKTLKISELRRV
ncbi:16S rRNA (guanine(527)-N(7))-methyltransferase RsmG [Thalassobium sp. R2A62]|jgi:16S rRNA (guanine527-N7)-methyltransferase|uniref:16S rRNA (guanine(527)-N(7))-methyltransferase RsmG n=1 Tax=Thalassobium sp. R2A62 TaxID=633131 RepID=UPI0001B1CC3C|nr:16S rRNA (guanine(527)-N(7))-methyltransferase RsmG [Thalassobium sp. R2A62]EET46442.1 16S rRNA methyltransferase GidB [Thalassobium sp. R2A62]MDG1339972.1 16S rRNA (guanine(527)-N(7))-methyltransferase RsmG [Paracoccaceae bacterium]MDG1801297.1 16S rRNA (guanine(527)-N(7))-methyltransferase RsmG [Paracoccaceae bacterium]MDG2452275.1 16S rRNA (guanine(527)-N(7))-methyltransferase RsmG [Paracoccaceae bacterium]